MADGLAPTSLVKSPTTRLEAHQGPTTEGNHVGDQGPSHRSSQLRKRSPKQQLEVDESSLRQTTAGQDVYLGSYAQTTPRGSVDARSLYTPSAPSPRASVSHVQLEHLLRAVDTDLNSYGVEELRDGFFDASFYKPLERHPNDDVKKASATLPISFEKNHPLSIRRFVPQQLKEVRFFFRQITTTRAGVKLFKSFLGFFICYIICLIPVSRDWLGRYNYIIAVSAIINHPGRKMGSQIDGALLTILGTIAGLGWGSLALYVSTSTPTARDGYGGVLAAFLVVFTVTIGWLRSVFIRFYQAVLCAGFAIFYVCLADTGQTVGWLKVFDYGIPWVLGQAICLIVATVVLPDYGSRALAYSIHASLKTVEEGLQLPQTASPALKRDLAWQFVALSQATRDFAIEFAISRYHPGDMTIIRNLIQAVIRSLLSIEPDTKLFEQRYEHVDIDENPTYEDVDRHAAGLIRRILAGPTRNLIDVMQVAVKNADSMILHLGGQESKFESIEHAIAMLRLAKIQFDAADLALLSRPDLPASYAKQPDCIALLLFLHPVRQTADKVEAFAQKVLEIQQRNQGWRIRAPSYPWKKASMRTNAQVRHDRGGLTAGFYFRSQNQLQRTMADLQSTVFVPANRHEVGGDEPQDLSVIRKYEQEKELANGQSPNQGRTARFRYRLWEALHRLQGFETRFAFKVTLATTLVSIPAWLTQSRGWWNRNESWWAVVMVWIMMHPRVGGTFQDLIVRAFCAAIGAIWGGFAYAAGNGDPYIIGIFAAIYMIPMLHRFTQSSHPRSGVVGCISFTVVSLTAYTNAGQQSVFDFAWTRGLAFIVGVVAAVIVNWVLWPFIARHELRKSLSAMMLHSAILYRGVVAKYIYYKEGQQPGPSDIASSEMLEGRLREGFVRIRQLLELTRHEMRLRAPFNPLPYSALISACEGFFEHLVQVRQSSLYFQPSMRAPASSPTASSLMSYRRDAVAVILLNLYILACALRADQPVPRYIPSAAAARQKLLDRMEIVEAEAAARERAENLARTKSPESEHSSHSVGVALDKGKRRWADVYEYAFSGALTDIVEEVQEIQKYTKEICGEVGWD